MTEERSSNVLRKIFQKRGNAHKVTDDEFKPDSSNKQAESHLKELLRSLNEQGDTPVYDQIAEEQGHGDPRPPSK